METNAPPKNKGGRPLGATNRLAQESRRKAQETGLLPHEILLSMARGEPQIEYLHDPISGQTVQKYVSLDVEQRKDAAKAAAPYFAPKISTVEVIRGVADDELDRIIAQLASEAGVGVSIGGEEPEDEGSSSKTSRPRTRIVE